MRREEREMIFIGRGEKKRNRQGWRKKMRRGQGCGEKD